MNKLLLFAISSLTTERTAKSNIPKNGIIDFVAQVFSNKLFSAFSYRLITVAFVTVIAFIALAQFFSSLQETFVEQNLGPVFGVYIFGGIFVALALSLILLVHPTRLAKLKEKNQIPLPQDAIANIDYRSLILQFSLGIANGISEKSRQLESSASTGKFKTVNKA